MKVHFKRYGFGYINPETLKTIKPGEYKIVEVAAPKRKIVPLDEVDSFSTSVPIEEFMSKKAIDIIRKNFQFKYWRVDDYSPTHRIFYYERKRLYNEN